MSRKVNHDTTKPVELIVLSAILALFVGLIVLMSSRNTTVALVAFGVGFIIALMVLAMLALASKPDPEPEEESDTDDASPHS